MSQARSSSSSRVQGLQGNAPRLRRSNSLTSIPLPRNSTRQSRRDSRDDHFLIVPNRMSSTSRLLGKSSSSSRTTSTPAGASTSRSTPSSTIKYKCSMTPLNDKTQLKNHHLKVQQFIETSGLFNLQIVNRSNIKPPTLNTFIYIVDILFGKLVHQLRVTKENYKEVIPTQLKLLKYPAPFTQSTLKTVSAQHTWPHVITMLSWLADWVAPTITKGTPNIVVNADPAIFSIHECILDYVGENYALFNKNGVTDNPEITDKYTRALETHLNIDASQLEYKLERNAERRSFIEQQKEHCKEMEEKLLELETACKGIESENERLEEDIAVSEYSVESELKQLRETLQKLKMDSDEIDARIKDIRTQIANQPFALKDLNMLKKSIEETKNDIDRINKIKENWIILKDKSDNEYTKSVKEIELLVLNWNEIVINLSFDFPEVLCLKLPDKSVYNEEFTRQISEKAALAKNLEEKYKKLSTQSIQETEMLEERCEQLKQFLDIEKTFQRWKNIQRDQEEEFMEYKALMKKRFEELEVETKKIDELKQREEQEKQDFLKFGRDCVHFYFNLNQIITKNVTKYKQFVYNQLQKENLTLIEKNEKLASKLEKAKETLKALNSYPIE